MPVPSPGRRSLADPATWFLYAKLAAAPAVLFVAHFFYGAYLPAPAMVLVFLGAVGLSIALTDEAVRGDLSRLRHLPLLATLFGGVLVVAALMQTDWLPGGAHPLWAWSDGQGASTLDLTATRLEMIKLCGAACFFVIGCVLGARPDRARQALGLILCMGAIYALIALVLFVTRTQIGWGSTRLLGGFFTPNSAATLLGMLTVIGLAWALRILRRARGVQATALVTQFGPIAAASLLFSGALLLTASRAGIVCTLAAVVLLLVYDNLSSRRISVPRIAATAIAVVAALVALAFLKTSLVDRFFEIGLSGDIRQTILSAHMTAIRQSPLFGYGLGTFPLINNQIMTPDTYRALSETVVMHNSYLQWIEEAGVVGALPMFLLVGSILALTGWHTLRRRSGAPLLLGLIASSLLIAAHAAVDVSLQMPSLVNFWACLLGLGFAYSQTRVERR